MGCGSSSQSDTTHSIQQTSVTTTTTTTNKQHVPSLDTTALFRQDNTQPDIKQTTHSSHNVDTAINEDIQLKPIQSDTQNTSNDISIFAKSDRLVKLQEEHKTDIKEDLQLNGNQILAQQLRNKQLDCKSINKERTKREVKSANEINESQKQEHKIEEDFIAHKLVKSKEISDTQNNNRENNDTHASRTDVLDDTYIDSEEEPVILENDTSYNRDTGNIWGDYYPSEQPDPLDLEAPDSDKLLLKLAQSVYSRIPTDSPEEDMNYNRGPNVSHADDMEQMRGQIDKKTDESLAATRRIKQIAVETERTGADALITLHEQGEQLDNVEDNLEDIGSAMKRTDKELTELEKCCGICRLPGSRVKSYQKSKNYKQAFGAKARKQEMISSQPGNYGATGNVVTKQPKGPIINRVTNDVREDEMEGNMQDVNRMLDNMKNIAGDMGDELDRQNDQLGRIEKKIVANEEHIRVANYRVAKQMN